MRHLHKYIFFKIKTTKIRKRKKKNYENSIIKTSFNKIAHK